LRRKKVWVFVGLRSLVENAYKKRKEKEFSGKRLSCPGIMRAWFSFWWHSFLFGVLK
jgi:hypothetical protein